MAEADEWAVNKIHADVAKRLRTRGHDVGRIWRVESAGESGTGDTTVLYTTPSGNAKTAFVGCEASTTKAADGGDDPTYIMRVVVIDGWNVL